MEGSLDSLEGVRHTIAGYSLKKASLRLELQRILKLEPEVPNFEVLGSQVIDDRVSMGLSFNLEGTLLGTASWSGQAHVWSIPDASLTQTLSGHNNKVQCISLLEQTPATGSFDTKVGVWKEGEPTWLEGHTERVNHVQWHPLGNILLSCSHDQTWKLWDSEHKKCLQTQYGHMNAVYCLSLHKDGGLVATGDLGGVGCVWDLRTGKEVLVLKSHLKQIVSISMGEDGHTLVTGSDDNTAKVWDLRRKGLVHSIPAHVKMVSGVVARESFIATCSYDSTTKFWNKSTFEMLKEVSYENKVTGIDSVGNWVATVSFDRTFKLLENGHV